MLSSSGELITKAALNLHTRIPVLASGLDSDANWHHAEKFWFWAHVPARVLAVDFNL